MNFPAYRGTSFDWPVPVNVLAALLRHDGQQLEQAQHHLRRAVELLTELVRDYPNTPDYQSHLAAALDGLLELPRSVIDLDEARQLLELAIEHQTEAVKLNPDHREYRRSLAAHFGSLAVVLEELGESDRASQAYTRRTEILSQLAGEDAETFEIELLQSRLAYADWLTRHGDLEDAEELYQELIATCSSDERDGAAAPDRLSLLGSALHGLGNVRIAATSWIRHWSISASRRHQESALAAIRIKGNTENCSADTCVDWAPCSTDSVRPRKPRPLGKTRSRSSATLAAPPTRRLITTWPGC